MRAIERQILGQLHDLRENRQSTDYEREWIHRHLTNDHLKELLPKVSVVSLHMLTALLEQPLTGIQLADDLKVTRGGITRAAKNLLKFGLVESFKKTTDHKKVFYQLTPDGEELAKCHRQMHETMNERFAQAIGKRYSEKELQLCSRFLLDVGKLEKELGN